MPCLWKFTTTTTPFGRNTVLDIKYFEVVLAQAKAIHEARRELQTKWEMTMSTQNNHHSDLTVADVMLPLEKTRKHLLAPCSKKRLN